jgi:hypothetical protein
MEQYLQELDKINELLVHTDVKPAPFWSFLLSHPWICLGIVLFVIVVDYTVEDYNIPKFIEFSAVLLTISCIIFIIGLFTDLTTSKHDLISVTKDSYVNAINYVADLPEDKFQQLYNDTEKYEFTEAQCEKYNASYNIIRDYYKKIHKK